MSTEVIIAIAIAAIIIIAAGVLLVPRMRHARTERKREAQREQTVTEHRQESDAHAQRAEEAEREARMAGRVAQRERATAELHTEEADRYEEQAPDELTDRRDRERKGRFTSRERGEASAAEAPPERLPRP